MQAINKAEKEKNNGEIHKNKVANRNVRTKTHRKGNTECQKQKYRKTNDKVEMDFMYWSKCKWTELTNQRHRLARSRKSRTIKSYKKLMSFLKTNIDSE